MKKGGYAMGMICADEAMKAKQDEIADLQRQLLNFSEQNGDLIERVGFVNDLMGQGKVRQDENGHYQMVEDQA